MQAHKPSGLCAFVVAHATKHYLKGDLSMEKVARGKYFDVVAYKGFGGLCLTHQDNVEDVVKDIDDIVKRAKEQGYNNDEKWVIFSVEWMRVWNDDVFVSSWEHRQAVALYDNGVVTDL